MHIPIGDYASPEHVAELTREAEPILAELGISTETAYRLLLDRVAQHDPEVLAWLRAAAAHDAWFRSKVEAALDAPHPPVPHRQVMDEAQALIDDIKPKHPHDNAETQEWLDTKPVGREMKWSNWSGHPDKPHNGGN
ncbi:antitoxin PaaA2 family protein, partial [Chromohalobacter israelensis]